jgi:hypothetical protein
VLCDFTDNSSLILIQFIIIAFKDHVIQYTGVVNGRIYSQSRWGGESSNRSADPLTKEAVGIFWLISNTTSWVHMFHMQVYPNSFSIYKMYRNYYNVVPGFSARPGLKKIQNTEMYIPIFFF